LSGAGQARAARRAALVPLLRDAVLLVDADLDVIDDNGVVRRWLGLTSGPPRDLLAQVHREDGALLRAYAVAVRWARPGWRPVLRVRLRHADGGWRTMEVQANNQLADPAVAAIVVQARDVTEVVPGPAEPETLLREVLAHAPVALLSLDLDGVVRFAVGAALQLDLEQLVGRSVLDLTESPEQAAQVRRALGGEEFTTVAFWAGRHWQARYHPLRQGDVVTAVVAAYVDITTQVLAERARAAGEAHLRAVVEAAQEAIIVFDPEGRVSSANGRCARLFGAPVPPGTALRELLDEQAATVLEDLARGGTGEPDRYELRLQDATGTPLWVLVSASPMWGEEGEFLGSVAVLTDITANKAVERRLEAVALTDAVTGVANRFTLSDRLSHALSRRSAGVVAVLFCDVDELKATNDRLGHAAGDELLRAVASRAAAALRPADSLARFAGDEFVIVCEELHTREEAVHLAERVRAAVALPLVLAGAEVVPTLSIGVATSPPCTSPDELLAKADAAAYVAKRGGRNAVHLSL